MTTNRQPRQDRAANALHPVGADVIKADPFARPGPACGIPRAGWWIGGILGAAASIGICVEAIVFDRSGFVTVGLLLLVPYLLMLAAGARAPRAGLPALDGPPGVRTDAADAPPGRSSLT